MRKRLWQRFMPPTGRQAEVKAGVVIPSGPYAGRTQLDQEILASVNIAIEETLSPDFWKDDSETARLDEHWAVYSRNLNL